MPTQTEDHEIQDLSVFAAGTPIVSLLQGVDTFTGYGLNTALTCSTNSGGASSEVNYTRCYDTQSVMRAMEINASASVTYGAFEGDAKAKYVRDLQLTTYSLTILVYARSTSERRTAQDTELIASKKPKDMNDFFKAYGDSFVSSIEYGAYYVASYVFYAESETDRTVVESELAAQGIVSGGKVSASFSEAISNVKSRSNSKCSFRQTIAGISGVSLPSEGEMVDFALKFGKEDVNEPVVISYTTASYDTVPDMPAAPGTRQNVLAFHGTATKPGVSQKIATIAAILAEIDRIQGLFARYSYDEPDLDARRLTFVEAKNDLDAWIERVHESANEVHPVPATMQLETPIIQFSVKDAFNLGDHTGGSPWGENDRINRGWVQHGYRISSIRFRGGNNVDKIVITYQPMTGSAVKFEHGSNDGTESALLQLSDQEQLNKFKGSFTYGKNLNYLVIETNRGQQLKSYVTDPKKGNGEFSEDVTDIFVGFKGRSGSRVDQITPVAVSFQPTQWVVVL